MSKVVFDKLKQCPTSDQLKLDVLEICAQEKNETDIKEKFDTFAKEHELKGDDIKLEAGEILGHIKDFDGLLNVLVNKTGFKRNRLKKVFTALCLDEPGQMQGDIDSFFKVLEKNRFPFQKVIHGYLEAHRLRPLQIKWKKRSVFLLG